MEAAKRLYLNFYFFVMALYVFFNKGIAYSFLAEILWATGFILLFLSRRSYHFVWDKRSMLLLFFIIVSLIYIPIGMRNYPIIDVIRDSFIFQYGWFAFFVFLFYDMQKAVWKNIIRIYTWFPIFGLLNFFLINFIKDFDTVSLFGDVPFVLYKYGDMGVHLLISSLILLAYQNHRSVRFQVVMALLILFNLLILTAYSRSGMLAYVLGVSLFVFFTKSEIIKSKIKLYLKYLPILLLIVIPIYASIKVQENFQGRAVGVEQLKQNVGSFVGVSKDDNLDNNKIWRLVWWGKILDYSFSKEYFFQGKGLGLSLAESDDVMADVEELRSPHNFHLNIMARFGVPIFCIWLFWVFLIFKPLFRKQLNEKEILITIILLAFIINASFDVFLEGPMGAFPFWTWFGLLLISSAPTPLSQPNNLSQAQA